MSNSMLSQLFFQMIGITIVLNSCSPSHITQHGVPTFSPQEQVKAPMQNGWARKQAPGFRQYLIEDSSTISIDGDSTQISMLHSTALYSLSFIAQGDSFSFTATVDSISTSSRLPSERNETDRSFSQVVHAIVSSTGQMSVLNAETASSCQGGMDAAAMRVFELTQNYPKIDITIGDKWADTVSVISCRGKTPLHQQIIRQYELLELTNRKQHNVAKIQRITSATVRGTSSNPHNHLTVAGSGTGSTTFYVDLATGFLSESEGHSQAKLTITTSRGNYAFIQNITTHINIQ